jgi:phosphoglycolate phosphatase
MQEYAPVMEQEVKPFPGMKHVLHMLSKNYTIVVISSTATLPIKAFLVKYGLAEYIHEVLGNDVHTSKVVKTHMVFQNYHIEGKDCLFITDTLGDLKEASRSGVRAVGVTWGYNKVEILHRGPYYRLVNTPKEIPIAVNDYFNQKTR